MLNDNNKILKYNYGEKSMRALFIIYNDLKCLLEKMHCYQNNPEKSYAEKKIKLMVYLLVTCFLQIFHLMKQKTNLIVTKVKTVWKGFVKT